MRNRLKVLYLIDRVPEELWMEVHDIVQETVIKTISDEKKCKKAKWLSEDALQTPEERRGAKGRGKKERYTYSKGRGKKERYTYLNAEFQIARRDKRAFLTYQCKQR